MTTPTLNARPHRARAYFLARPKLRFLAWILLVAGVLVSFVLVGHVTSAEVATFVNGAAEAALYVVAIPAGIFFVVYTYFLTDIRNSPAGRPVVLLGLLIVVLMSVNALTLLLGPDYAGRPYLRLVSYSGLAVGLVYLAFSVVHLNVLDLIQRREDRARAEERERALAGG